jgi:hypothetical protein
MQNILFADMLLQIAIMNATSTLGRILPSLNARRYGILNLYMLFLLCMGILIFCLGTVKDTTGMAIFSSIYGIFTGAGKLSNYFSKREMFKVFKL